MAIVNENTRIVAASHDALIADLWALRELTQPLMWDPYLLRFSPLGHHTIAMMVLETLNVPHTLQPMTLKDLPERRWREARTDDIVWARRHLVPWVVWHLKNRVVEEEQRAAKRPDAGPVFGAGMPPGSSMGSP